MYFVYMYIYDIYIIGLDSEVDVDGNFDIDIFLNMKSSVWLFMKPSCTIAFGSHMQHRVLTLEKYK